LLQCIPSTTAKQYLLNPHVDVAVDPLENLFHGLVTMPNSVAVKSCM